MTPLRGAKQPMYRSDNDLSNLLDDGERQPRSQRPRPDKTRQDVRAPAQAPSKGNQKPDEVSDRIWDLAEHWLALGEQTFGKRPPVNKAAFAKKLSAKVNSDQVLRKQMGDKEFENTWRKSYFNGLELVTDVLNQMCELFFKYLDESQKNTSSLQFDFLDAEWDNWVEQGLTMVRVNHFKKHGTWSKPTLPSGVFDPSTVGKPDPDSLINDPSYPEGTTWAQARAMDHATLVAEANEPYESPERELHPALASWKRDKVATRQTATKETTDD